MSPSNISENTHLHLKYFPYLYLIMFAIFFAILLGDVAEAIWNAKSLSQGKRIYNQFLIHTSSLSGVHLNPSF